MRLNASGGIISSLSAVSSVTAKPTACRAFNNDATDTLETDATVSTSLRYDSTSNQFVYTWKKATRYVPAGVFGT